MRKKSKNSAIKKRGHLRKFGHITLLVSAIVVGIVFAQNGSKPETKKTPPQIESVSPSVIIVGK